MTSRNEVVDAPAIRAYRPSDLNEVLAVWASASALAHPFLSETFLAGEREAIASVHLARAETWVWDSGGRVGGFLSLLGNEIGALFIDPRHHRGGIGRALVEHARRLHGPLEVEVFEANAIGRAFYAKMGFVPLETRVHAETGLVMMRLGLAAD